jgi:hypothetical protein
VVKDQTTLLPTFDEGFLDEFDRLYERYFRERFRTALEYVTHALKVLLGDESNGPVER